MLSEAERIKKADDANVIIQKVLLLLSPFYREEPESKGGEGSLSDRNQVFKKGLSDFRG